jgi:hypothetical protein
VFWGPRIWDVAAGALLAPAAGREVWVRTRGGWQRFERFEAPARLPGREAAKPGETPRAPSLRDWRQPVLVGTAEACALIRERTRPPGAVAIVFARLRRLLRWGR